MYPPVDLNRPDTTTGLSLEPISDTTAGQTCASHCKAGQFPVRESNRLCRFPAIDEKSHFVAFSFELCGQLALASARATCRGGGNEEQPEGHHHNTR